jgi:curved DNA-binding protein CbpA
MTFMKGQYRRMTKDYYRLLQVHPDADADVIHSAYKRLSRKLHPDVNKAPNAQSQMQALNAAYEILSNPARRRLYHAEWLRANASVKTAPSAERIVYVQREPFVPKPDPGTLDAKKAVQNYFQHISQGNYKEAYEFLSAADTGNFSFASFSQWQISVSALYEIGNIETKLFRRINQLTIGNEKFRAEEFTVVLAEKHRQTGAVTECSFNKTVIYENGRWCVHLGYRDLSPLTMQFRSVASNQEEAHLMGLWERYKSERDTQLGLLNGIGFSRELDSEIYRSKRYGSPFCLSVLHMFWPDWVNGDEQRERVLRFVGYLLGENIRIIDKLGYLGDQQFVVLLAEVHKNHAALALRRIMKNLRQGVGSCFDFALDVRVGLVEYGGTGFEDMVSSCRRIINDVGAEAASG